MRTMSVLLPVLLAFLVGASPAHAWTWPVDGPVLQAFDFGDDPYAAGQHRGIDVGAPSGSPVRAPAGGTVSFAGSVPGGGRTVTIRTGDGYAVTLLHLGTVSTRRGSSVAEGETVGTIGPSGEAEHDEPYVHLGIRVASQPEGYVDPLSLLPRRWTVPASDEPAVPHTEETPAEPEPAGEGAAAAAPADAAALGEEAALTAAPAGAAAPAEAAEAAEPATTAAAAATADPPIAEPAAGLAIRVASGPEGHVDPASVVLPAPDAVVADPTVPAAEDVPAPAEPGATLVDPPLPTLEAGPMTAQGADEPVNAPVPVEAGDSEVPAEAAHAPVPAVAAHATTMDASESLEPGEVPQIPELPAGPTVGEGAPADAPVALPFAAPAVWETSATSAEPRPSADALEPRPQVETQAGHTVADGEVVPQVLAIPAAEPAGTATPEAVPGQPASSLEDTPPDGSSVAGPPAGDEPVTTRSHSDPSVASVGAAVAREALPASPGDPGVERRRPVSARGHERESAERLTRPGTPRNVATSGSGTAVPRSRADGSPVELSPGSGAARLMRIEAAGPADVPVGAARDRDTSRSPSTTHDRQRDVGLLAVVVGAFALLTVGTTVAFVSRRASRLRKAEARTTPLAETAGAEPIIESMQRPRCAPVREERRRRGAPTSRRPARHARARVARGPRVPAGIR